MLNNDNNILSFFDTIELQSFKNPVLTALLSLLTSFSSNALASNTDSKTERIISAGSAVTEIIEALGAQDQLVAIDVTSEQPKGRALPVVGYHRQLSTEGLMALQPSLLIGSDEMGPDSTLNTLKQAGIAVEIVNNEATIEGLDRRIEQIAHITGKQQQAISIKQNVDKQVAALKSHQPQDKKKVMFLLIHEGRPANVAGNHTTPNALIEIIGAINPAAVSLDSYKPISLESMIEMQPDVILVSGRSLNELGGADAILKKMPMLAATPAGETHNIISIDGKALVGGVGLKTLSEAARIQPLIYPSE
ncbi:heme/hemin ABC transporter substrate-binding protein [Vibrio algivorus]|uniref:Hemin ABC transporter substrate-binding protein n=1 Tax=Vibrio algivorus TaxID=1667024 RepID=A0ABQ6EN37_9VIBR|nr:ABC transporter substrate-binding protein [Vibrio algivorus]GLT14545.1 hemin ABC transporter substrate-binding protein [Vibrio algivorus]